MRDKKLAKALGNIKMANAEKRWIRNAGERATYKKAYNKALRQLSVFSSYA